MKLTRTPRGAGALSAGALALQVALVTLGGGAAQASQAQPDVVTDVASTATPRVVGGQCYAGVPNPEDCRRIAAMVKIGPWIYAGGVVDRVANNNGTNVRSGFSNLFRFDAVTKALDPTFKPQLLDGSLRSAIVRGLVASPDGSRLYVVGGFTGVRSSGDATTLTRKGIVALDPQTGAVLTGFDARVCQGGGPCEVHDVEMIGQQLWVGGSFTRVARTARSGLASLDPATGALTGAVTLGVSGRGAAQAPTRVTRIRPNPASTKAVVLGNFTSIGGQTREEVALVDVDPTTGAATRVNPWDSPSLPASVATCSSRQPWPRDVDWAPDGSTFAIVGTGAGGARPYPALCDSYTLWADNDDPRSVPLGYNHTEIDTIGSVCNVGRWSYVGGHFKSLNQERRIDGALAPPPRAQRNETHYGLGAIDNSSFLAVPSWNDTDQTGRGAGWDSVLCLPGPGSQGGGVYFGGDAVKVNGNRQIQRLAHFPSAG